jgi:hypothetical protein
MNLEFLYIYEQEEWFALELPEVKYVTNLAADIDWANSEIKADIAFYS